MLREQLLPHVLFEALEPAADPSAGVVEPGLDPTPAPDPGAGGPSADPDPAPSPAPAPAIDWDNPEIQAELSRRADAAANAALEQRLAAAGLSLGEPEPQGGFELDPFADNFGDQLVQVMQAVLGQGLAPVNDMMQERQFTEFEQTIGGEISKLTGHGIDDPDQAKAAEFYGIDPEGVRFLGEAFATRVDPNSPNAVGEALRQGAEWLKSYRDRERQEAVLDYRRQLGEIVDAPVEPSGHGAALPMETNGGSYDERFARVLARHGINQ